MGFLGDKPSKWRERTAATAAVAMVSLASGCSMIGDMVMAADGAINPDGTFNESVYESNADRLVSRAQGQCRTTKAECATLWEEWGYSSSTNCRSAVEQTEACRYGDGSY